VDRQNRYFGSVDAHPRSDWTGLRVRLSLERDDSTAMTDPSPSVTVCLILLGLVVAFGCWALWR